MVESSFLNRNQAFTRFSTLRDWLAIGFRRRRLVLLSFFGVFLGATLFAWFWAANYFESSMKVLVQQDRSDPAITSVQNASILTNTLVTPDQINSEVSLLQGGDMLRTIVTTCGLEQDSLTDVFLPSDPAERKAIKVAKAAQRLAKALDVEAEKNSDTILVTYGRRGAPQVPACVLENLSRLYLEKHLQLRRPTGTSDFFAQETEKYQQALTAAELQLAKFGVIEGVVAPDVERTNMAQQVVNSVAALHQTQQAIAADQHRIAEAERQLESTPSRSSTQEISNSADVLMQQLQATLLTAQIKKTQLLLKYDPSYPLVKEVDQEIAQTQSAIEDAQKTRFVNHTTDRDPTFELLREDIVKTRVDLASQTATAAQLENSIKSMQLQMVDWDQKAVRQGSLIREAKANESNYLLYLAKREQERTADALDKKRIANVSIAVPPFVPSLPLHSPWQVMLIGFFVALFVCVSSAVVAEHLDPSFQSPLEVAELLNVPVVVSVPHRAA
jgi:uncharacterized protein involved in exopolysaccharide biosynthesis